MTPSKILFYLCISFVAGIFIGSLVKIPQIPEHPAFSWVLGRALNNLVLWFLLVGVLIIIVSLFVKKDNFLVIGFCFLFLVIGILRMQISEFNIANDELRKFNDKGEIVLAGRVIKEPDVRDNSQKLKIEIENPKGVVLVTTGRWPEYKYLDKIKITGKLETPNETEDFSYKNYLMKDKIYSVINFPKIELISKEHNYNIFSYLYEKILFLKQELRESIRNNFSPPQSYILEGMILGDKKSMPKDLKDKLSVVGLSHIVAVSGMHIVILTSIIMFLLLAMGFWRGQAFYIAIVFICFYIVLTGLPASGVRAGIMGGLYLLAQKLGRQTMGSRVITMAGAVMLVQNPLLLFYDVGFQLSFLAVIGIIYLEPFIKDFLKIFTKKKAENLVSILSITFAAQIFTLPIMVYNFGNMSLVSPITNILILPIVSGLMILGFLSSILGAVSQFLGWIVSIPCWFLLTYFIKVIDTFSQPWAIKTIENVHWIWLFISYLILGVITRWLQKNQKLKIIEY